MLTIVSARSSYHQQLDEQESRLFDRLSELYSNIQRDLNLDVPSGKVTWQEIQFLYQEQIDDSISSL